MANQMTIPVQPEIRDRVREIKGFERSYAEPFTGWAERAENAARS